jgi:magnesium-protoporphyrin IX monomethyl ester (oxidative) cyclase
MAVTGDSLGSSEKDLSINLSTEKALEETMLSPRFYTTDFAAIDKISIEGVREEWDKLMSEFEVDSNIDHFQRPKDMQENYSKISPEVYDEFVDFLISSITSEFSGCVLYAEIKKRVKNDDMKKLFGYMARDESRHAGFINQWLKDFNIGVDLSFLTKAKKYTFFKPKFIFYATYLSEKIGYARYISIYRQVERHPEFRFHPIFLWFEKWCNDEFRHGEAFALLMRSDPTLLKGTNLLWIKFFLLAVFATMFVRDHKRPMLHKALKLSPTEYDMQVFEITTEISKQVFPVLLDIKNPNFLKNLKKLSYLNEQLEQCGTKGIFSIRRLIPFVKLGVCFTRLFFMKSLVNKLPEDFRVKPSW